MIQYHQQPHPTAIDEFISAPWSVAVTIGNPTITRKTDEQPKSQPKVAPIERPRTITIGQERFLERLLAEAGWEEARLLDYFGIQSTAELPMAEFDRAMKALQQANRRAAA